MTRPDTTSISSYPSVQTESTADSAPLMDDAYLDDASLDDDVVVERAYALGVASAPTIQTTNRLTPN